jgi:MFS family permease
VGKGIGLPKSVVKLGWISFFADVCSEMAYPVLPLFLQGTLKAPGFVIGLVEGIAESIVSFMKGWSGWHSDKLGKRAPFIQWGYGLSAVGKPLIGAAFAWPMVLVARSLDRFGKGLRTTARDAMIADAVEPHQYGRAYGFHRAMDTAGAFVGVLIALLMLWLLPGQYRLVFLVAVVPGIVSWLITLSIRDKQDDAKVQEQHARKVPWAELRSNLSRDYWVALWLCCVFALANTSDTFLLLYAKKLGLSDVQVIWAYIAYNVVVALLATPMGILSDRFGRWRIIVIGWSIYGVTYIGFAFSNAATVWLLFGLYGMYYALSQGAGKALVADHAPKAYRGSAIGLFTMVSGFATLAGNVAMGAMWDWRPGWALMAAGGLALFASVAVLLKGKEIHA